MTLTAAQQCGMVTVTPELQPVAYRACINWACHVLPLVEDGAYQGLITLRDMAIASTQDEATAEFSFYHSQRLDGIFPEIVGARLYTALYQSSTEVLMGLSRLQLILRCSEESTINLAPALAAASELSTPDQRKLLRNLGSAVLLRLADRLLTGNTDPDSDE